MAAATAIDRRLWVEDDVAARCHACAAQFSLFLRRHHCRRCGMAFCADCSPDTYPLASSHVFGQVTDERVCRRCCSALQEERGKQLGRSRSGEAAQPAAERQQRNRHWEKDVLGHPRSAATDPPAQQRAEAHADAERQRWRPSLSATAGQPLGWRPSACGWRERSRPGAARAQVATSSRATRTSTRCSPTCRSCRTHRARRRSQQQSSWRCPHRRNRNSAGWRFWKTAACRWRSSPTARSVSRWAGSWTLHGRPSWKSSRARLPTRCDAPRATTPTVLLPERCLTATHTPAVCLPAIGQGAPAWDGSLGSPRPADRGRG